MWLLQLWLAQASLRRGASACPPPGLDLAALPNNTAYQQEVKYWDYMQGSCMQKRRDYAVQMLAARKCKRVADIGALHLRLVDDPQYPKPDLYVNIDPSAQQARVEQAGGHCALDLPLTTQQFTPDWDFDCVVVIGAMREQFADGAMERLLAKAHTLVMEEAMTDNPASPAGNCSTFRTALPMLGGLGFASKDVDAAGFESKVSPLCGAALPVGAVLDCTADSEAGGRAEMSEDERAQWGDIFVRQLAVFERD